MKQIKQKQNGILIYTLAFIIVSVLIFGVFYLRNFSFVSKFDGVGQHYPMLVELRNIIISRLNDPLAPIKFWTWNLGIGSDVIHSMSYYGLGDLISYLIIFFPKQHLEFGYGVLMILRMYLAGVSLIIYLKKYQYSSIINASSGIFYAFCGTLLMFVHPFFANPLILLPILLKSVDSFFEGKSIKSFPWLVAYTFMNNFYFAYMLVIMVVFYFFLQYILVFKNTVNFWKVFSKLTVHSVVGVLISCILFFPSVIGTLNSTRAERPFSNGISFYPLEYYLKLLNGFIGPVAYLPYSTKLSFASIAVFATTFIFLNRKKYRALFVSIMCSFFILIFPYGAAIMNGFTSPANRWAFGLSFILAISVAHFLDNIKYITIKEIKVYIISCFVFFVSYWVQPGYNMYSVNMMIPLIFLSINIGLILFSYIQRKEMVINVKLPNIFFLIICLNVTLTGNFYFSDKGNGEASSRRQANELNESIENQYQGLENAIEDDLFYRTSTPSKGATYNLEQVNNSILLNNPEVASYLSVQNENIGQFAREMENNQFTMTNPLQQLDDRTTLMNYLGIKYLFVGDQEVNKVPYSYNKEQEKDSMHLYSTENALPIAFMNYNEISQESYNKLSANEKEDFLIQGVVTEKTLNKNFKLPEIVDYNELEFQILENNNNNSLEISNNKKQYQINIEKPEDTINKEIYLQIQGLHYTPYTFTERWEDIKKERIPRRTTYDFFKNNVGAHYSDGYNLSFNTDLKTNTIRQYTKYDPSSYDPKEDFLINLGYYKEELSNISIESSDLGFFTFENIKLITKNFNEEYKIQTELLQNQALEQVDFSTNQLEGVITNDQDGYLVTSIPYSSGWKVYVDEELVETEKANIGFLSVFLENGTHEIRFVYESPGFKVALYLSIIGVLLWGVLFAQSIVKRS